MKENMLPFQTGNPISIALPVTYKYLNKEFIDLFFEKGILRISSFNKFTQYPDEVRGDKSEGAGAFQAQTIENSKFLLMTNVGGSAYMFCTSLIASEEIQGIFGVDSYFKITKPLDFFTAISNAIHGFNQGFLGFCNYQDGRIVKKELENFSIQEFTNNQGSFILGGPEMDKRISEMVGNSIDLLFLKENKYQNQAEFRFVWTINKNFYDMHEHLDICCKEALQFCERIN